MDSTTLYNNEPIIAEIQKTSMRAFARRCGVDVGTIARAKEGLNVSIDTLRKIALGADISICKLIGCNCSHEHKKNKSR